MARSPFIRALKRLIALNELADETGRPVAELRDEVDLRPSLPLSRRSVIAGAVAAGTATACASALGGAEKAFAARPPGGGGGGSTARIAIIGGGMAGLSTALTLSDAGYSCTLYEALPNRVGGRMLSDKQTQPACGTCHTVNRATSATWADGQFTDVFGELIDTGHTTMQSLCQRFGLPLVDLFAAEPPDSTETYYFMGRNYSAVEAQADFDTVYRAIKADLRAAGYPTTYNSSTAAGRVLDSMTMYDWIESRVPGGHSSRFGRLLDAAYVIEYGADTVDQSALNLLYLLGYTKGTTFTSFGESDERYRIDGGVDRLPFAMAGQVSSRCAINLDWVLSSIALQSGGSYQLSFHGRSPVTADIVVLCLPFPALRANVDISKAGFNALKLRAIQEQGAAINGKVQLQFTSRLWNTQGPWGLSNGSGFSDTGFQATWDPTRGQAGTSGILLSYTGGSVALAMSQKHPYGTISSTGVLADAQRFLAQAEPVFPGLTAKWNGRAAGCMPHLNPFFRSAYAYYRPGQNSLFGGYEAVPQGRVFFAGEHTSIDFLGYMEGAAREGIRAGKEVIAALK